MEKGEGRGAGLGETGGKTGMYMKKGKRGKKEGMERDVEKEGSGSGGLKNEDGKGIREERGVGNDGSWVE